MASPARSASSTNAVPGSRTVPRTRWSVSQDVDVRDSLDVNRYPSPSARGSAAPSSGCAGSSRPAAVTSPEVLAPSGQYRSRWNG